MKIFLDTANIDEIKRVNEIIHIDGVTTNPTLMLKERFDEIVINNKCEYVISKILSEVHNNINVELMSTTIEDATIEIDNFVETLYRLDKLKRTSPKDFLVFKIPTTSNGLKIMKFLSGQHYKINATLIFTPLQALLASKAGADYVSIFVGRLDDSYGIGVGMLVVEETLKTFKQYNIKTEVIVASIRNLEHIKQSAILGAHIVTVPPKFIDEMIYHQLTEKGVEQFIKAWRENSLTCKG